MKPGRWQRISANMWCGPMADTIVSDRNAKRLVITPVGKEVSIPLTVVRSVFEDMGYRVEKAEEFDKITNALNETLEEKYRAAMALEEAKEDHKKRQEVNLRKVDTSRRELRKNKTQLATAVEVVAQDNEVIDRLKTELKEIRQSILTFANLLMQANVMVNTAEVGKDLAKRFYRP